MMLYIIIKIIIKLNDTESLFLIAEYRSSSVPKEDFTHPLDQDKHSI